MTLFFQKVEDLVEEREIEFYKLDDGSYVYVREPVFIPSGKTLFVHELPRRYFVKEEDDGHHWTVRDHERRREQDILRQYANNIHEKVFGKQKF